MGGGAGGRRCGTFVQEGLSRKRLMRPAVERFNEQIFVDGSRHM